MSNEAAAIVLPDLNHPPLSRVKQMARKSGAPIKPQRGGDPKFLKALRIHSYETELLKEEVEQWRRYAAYLKARIHRMRAKARKGLVAEDLESSDDEDPTASP